MKKLIPLITVCLMAAGLMSCDVTGQENFDFKPGDSLAIQGPFAYQTTSSVDTVFVDDTTSYYLRAFSSNKDYTWSVNGSTPFEVRREGEFIDVIHSSQGNYEITVEGPEYSGTIQVTARTP